MLVVVAMTLMFMLILEQEPTFVEKSLHLSNLSKESQVDPDLSHPSQQTQDCMVAQLLLQMSKLYQCAQPS